MTSSSWGCFGFALVSTELIEIMSLVNEPCSALRYVDFELLCYQPGRSVGGSLGTCALCN